jgi:hypothetical protein
MIIQKHPSVSPVKSRWVTDDLHQLLNDVIALRARVKALETGLEVEAAGRPARLSSVEREGSIDGSSARLG